MLLFCATQAMSCSAQQEVARSGSLPGDTASIPPPLVTLTNRDGRMQLGLRLVEAPGRKEWTNALRLRAYEEEMVEGPLGGLWLNGVQVISKDAPRLIDKQSGNDWTCVSMDVTPFEKGKVRKFTRRLLHVEPDLFVVCDEVSLTEPAIVEIEWCFPEGVARESKWEEWRLQLSRAGLTARILGSPRNNEQSQPSPGAPGWVCVRSGTTNQAVEFRQITAMVPHEKQGRRSLAFKFLESDSAIGLRVHRDGLPTLIAFHKGAAVEANLTGLKFTGPVAVEVFRPKK